jgi:hypothetical protein
MQELALPENVGRQLHILNFFDDHVLRQHIQSPLNPGKFRVETEDAQQWNACCR